MSGVDSCHESASPEETEAFARALARELSAGDVVGLRGSLGAGKTCFTRGFVSGLAGGAGAQVSSPTYALLNVYPTDPVVYHFDLYRVTDVDDLETVGFWDTLDAGDGIVLVEWCERVDEVMGTLTLEVVLEVTGVSTRRLEARTAR